MFRRAICHVASSQFIQLVFTPAWEHHQSFSISTAPSHGYNFWTQEKKMVLMETWGPRYMCAKAEKLVPTLRFSRVAAPIPKG